MSSPFDYLKMINNKESAEVDSSVYNKFLMCRALSYHLDSVAVANHINMYDHITDQMHFDFLTNMVDKKSRFSKWHKPKQHPDAKAISEYYAIPIKQAYIYIDLFTQEQINEIKKQLEGKENE